MNPVSRFVRLASLLVSEALAPRTLQRIPEPAVVMEDPERVRAFHDQGDPSTGPLLPVYHLNAVATSRLMPLGGRLLDGGSGSGRNLIYLARCRQDIRITGLDMSGEMVSLGNAEIRKAGLEDRVRLVVGDMTDLEAGVQDRVDVVSSIFAFHHLPRREALHQCLESMARLVDRFGCAVWSFDHARPRLRWTADIFPGIFTPESPDFFNRDSTNSLKASFSFEELSASFDACFPGRTVAHARSKLLRLYQVHWMPGKRSGSIADPSRELNEDRLPADARKAYRSLQWLFRSTPLIRGAPPSAASQEAP
ncbi:MAG: class I SAM-dependent methyltransferase [Deltaproteobacteria bacterium]|nr:class I SAM-dependent methyltransferase [Deltaproteobacteria bacterium]